MDILSRLVALFDGQVAFIEQRAKKLSETKDPSHAMDKMLELERVLYGKDAKAVYGKESEKLRILFVNKVLAGDLLSGVGHYDSALEFMKKYATTAQVRSFLSYSQTFPDSWSSHD